MLLAVPHPLGRRLPHVLSDDFTDSMDDSDAIADAAENAVPYVRVQQVAVWARHLIVDAVEDGLEPGERFLDVLEIGFGRAALLYELADGESDRSNCLGRGKTGRGDAERVRHSNIQCLWNVFSG